MDSFFAQVKKNKTQVTLAVILGTYFFLSLQNLGSFISADEHYWFYERVPQYWHAIVEEKWSKTYINDKPGVTVALASGIGLLFEPSPETICRTTESQLMDCDTDRARDALIFFRIPIVLANMFLLGLLFWLVLKIGGLRIAAATTVFMSCSPILLGISQIANPDAFLWSFGAVSFFSFFLLLRSGEWKFLLLSGASLGFAMLSKYVASILIPLFLFISVVQLFSDRQTLENPSLFRKSARQALRSFSGTLAIALGIIAVFLPAVWDKPVIFLRLLSGGDNAVHHLPALLAVFILSLPLSFLPDKYIRALSKIIRRGAPLWSVLFRISAGIVLILFLALLIGRNINPDWQLFERIPFDTKELTGNEKVYGPNPTIIEAFLLEANPLVFALTPISLFFFLWILLRITFTLKKMHEFRIESLSILILIPIFFGILIASDILATPRYLILLFPLVAFLSGIGFADSLRLLSSYTWWRALRVQPVIALFAVLFATSLWSLCTSWPYPLAYANGLLPKGALISHSWGYGGYEAAQYLNALPNAKNLLVWSDYYGVCEFFVGSCIQADYKAAVKHDIDYVVLSHRGEKLYRPDHVRWLKEGRFYAKPAYEYKAPEWSIAIDSRPENYVKIVKFSDL